MPDGRAVKELNAAAPAAQHGGAEFLCNPRQLRETKADIGHV